MFLVCTDGGQGQSWNFNFYVIHYLDHIWTWDKEEDLPGLTVDFDVGPSPIDNLKNLPTIASSPTSITRRNRFAKSIKGQVTTMPYKKEIVNVVGTIKQIEVPFSARIYATYDDGSVQDFVTFGTYKGQEVNTFKSLKKIQYIELFCFMKRSNCVEICFSGLLNHTLAYHPLPVPHRRVAKA